MRLTLFNLLDDTLNLYEKNIHIYRIVESKINFVLSKILNQEQERIVGYQSRIKSKESLREKIIRNRYYITFDDAASILESASDIIGCRIDCRFLQDEVILLELLKNTFNNGDSAFKTTSCESKLYLDVITPQPQTQKNGLNIYRLDGFYIYDDKKIKFELQIKSLVNSFWGSIEHKLIYKNNNYLDNDDFMRKMLVSINQSLNVLDAQLNIVYDQIQSVSRKDIEFNEQNIELLITKAINDLFSIKMKENLGFSLSIKYTSRVLAHYLFNKDILYSYNGEDRIASLLKILRKISVTQIDFEAPIVLSSFQPQSMFQSIFGKYLIERMNVDYDWHVFFKMLFAVELYTDCVSFSHFLEIIQESMIESYWFETSFITLTKSEQQAVQKELMEIFINSLIHPNSIKIVAKKTAQEMNQIFRQFICGRESECKSYIDFNKNKKMYQHDWNYISNQILNSNH